MIMTTLIIIIMMIMTMDVGQVCLGESLARVELFIFFTALVGRSLVFKQMLGNFVLDPTITLNIIELVKN